MSTTMQVNARQRRNTKPVFGEPDTVPSEDIGLPENLCITAVELITYLPNSLRNYEPLLRLVQAGLDHVKLARIVNFHRQLFKDALGQYQDRNLICAFTDSLYLGMQPTLAVR